MSFIDYLGNQLNQGFSYSDISTTKILLSLCFSFVLALYVHFVYKFSSKNQFYNKNYGVCMVIISVVTAGIVLAMQSSLVISLGMVGALSIVRFRTAIKDPLELLFLFWSISIGIICGAGLYEIAILMSIIATLGIGLFLMIPFRIKTCLLVIHTQNKEHIGEIMNLIKQNTRYFAIKSKNLTRSGAELVFEVKFNEDDRILSDSLWAIPGVSAVNLLENYTNIS